MKKMNMIFYVISSLSSLAFAYTDIGRSYDRPQLGLQGGVNFESATSPSQVSTSTYTGFSVGTLLDIPLNTGVAIQPELNYSRRGLNISNGAGGGESSVYYHSLELPVFLKASIGEKVRPFLIIGPMATWNFSREVKMGATSTASSSRFNPRELDVSAVAGLGVAFGGFFVDARYALGLLDINETSGEWRSRGFKVMAGIEL